MTSTSHVDKGSLFSHVNQMAFFFFGQGFLKMSWDSYIDNLVAQTKDSAGTAHADKACIIGIDGGAPWTSSGHASALQVILW